MEETDSREMKPMDKKDLKLSHLILLLLIIFCAVGIYKWFYGVPVDNSWKKDLKEFKEADKKNEDSIRVLKLELQAIKEKQSAIESEIAQADKNIENTKKHFHEVRNAITALPDGEQLGYLSEWFPQIDTLR